MKIFDWQKFVLKNLGWKKFRVKPKSVLIFNLKKFAKKCVFKIF